MTTLQVPCKHCGKPIKAFWRAVMVNLPSRSGWLVMTGPYHERCGREVGSNTSQV